MTNSVAIHQSRHPEEVAQQPSRRMQSSSATLAAVLHARLDSRKTETMTAADTQFRSDFLRTLQARGYIHQITHPAELDEAASKGVVTGYIGFDATAPSLHVGSLIQ